MVPVVFILPTVLWLLQRITDISGLEFCPGLQTLLLIESQVQSTKGLEKLTKLRKLFLYSNKIQRIEGLDSLAELEVRLTPFFLELHQRECCTFLQSDACV